MLKKFIGVVEFNLDGEIQIFKATFDPPESRVEPIVFSKFSSNLVWSQGRNNFTNCTIGLYNINKEEYKFISKLTEIYASHITGRHIDTKKRLKISLKSIVNNNPIQIIKWDLNGPMMTGMNVEMNCEDKYNKCLDFYISDLLFDKITRKVLTEKKERTIIYSNLELTFNMDFFNTTIL
jgi:hypothetical protein